MLYTWGKLRQRGSRTYPRLYGQEMLKLRLVYRAAATKSLQSCLTLCDPWDGSLPGSPVPGILQARTLEWVAISFSNAEKWKVRVKSLSRVRLLATPWTAAHQAPSSMGFSRQEYWSGVPLLHTLDFLIDRFYNKKQPVDPWFGIYYWEKMMENSGSITVRRSMGCQVGESDTVIYNIIKNH